MMEADMDRARKMSAAIMAAMVTLSGIVSPTRGEEIRPAWNDTAVPTVWHPRSGVDLGHAVLQSASGATIPLWSGSFSYQGVTYPYVMVGTDPGLGSKTTKIPVVIVPIEFDLPGGVVLSPDAPVCGGSRSAVELTKKSPIFASSPFVVGGTKIGQTQYGDAFQRANFWSDVSTTSGAYHVKLKSPKVLPTQVVTVPAGSVTTIGSGACGEYAIIDFGFYVTTLLSIRSQLPQIVPTALAIALTYNTFITDPTFGFILGFHYAIDFGAGLQTFISAAYTDLGLYNPGDVAVLSHEVGEWIDDPVANNPTPGWFFRGQCQTSLEVGDPLTGVGFSVTNKTSTYHLQDLAFLPWFARETPSTSINGWYTFQNTLYAPPAVCQ
jgi:hypothetical protein